MSVSTKIFSGVHEKTVRKNSLTASENQQADNFFRYAFGLFVAVIWVGFYVFTSEENDNNSARVNYLNNDSLLFALQSITIASVFVITFYALKCTPTLFFLVNLSMKISLSVMLTYNFVANTRPLYYQNQDAQRITEIQRIKFARLNVILLFIFVNKLGFTTVLQYTKQLFRRKHFYHTEVFKSCIFFGQFVGFVIVLKVMLIFSAVDLTSSTSDSYLRYFILFASLYLIEFCLSFAQMAIAKAIVTYNWTTSRQETSNTDRKIFSSAATVIKCHFGSIAISASGVLPLVCAVFTVLKSKDVTPKRKIKPSNLQILYKIYSILNISKQAEILIAMRDYDYREAVKKSLKLVLANCTSSSIFIQSADADLEFITRAVILTILLITNSTSSTFVEFEPDILWLEKCVNINNFLVVAIICVTLDLAYCFFLPMNIVATSTVHATHLATLESKEKANCVVEEIIRRSSLVAERLNSEDIRFL